MDVYLRENASVTANDTTINIYLSISIDINLSSRGGAFYFNRLRMKENSSIDIDDVDINYVILANATYYSANWTTWITGGGLAVRDYLDMQSGSSIDIDGVSIYLDDSYTPTPRNLRVFGGAFWSCNDVKVNNDYFGTRLDNASISISNTTININNSAYPEITGGAYAEESVYGRLILTNNSRISIDNTTIAAINTTGWFNVYGGAFYHSQWANVSSSLWGYVSLTASSISISDTSITINASSWTRVWGGAYADTTVYSRLILTNNSRIDIDNTYISQNALSTVEVTGGAFYQGYVSLTDSSISISDTRYGDMNAANGTTTATFNGGAAWIYNTMTLDRSSFTVDGVRRTYTAVEEGSVFQADTDYYTRSGSGTEQDPFVYTLAKVTVGAVAGAGFYTGTTLNALTGLTGGGLRMEGSITMKNSDLAAAMTEFGTSTIADTVAAKVNAVIAETVETAMASQEVLDEIEADVQTALGEDPALDEDTVRAGVTAAKREALTALYTASLTAEQTAKYTALYSQRSALTVRNVDLAWTKRASRVANDAITGGGIYMGTLTANYADILVENIKLRAVDYSLKDLNGTNPQNWNSSINGGGMRVGRLTVQDSSFEIADIGISIDVTASETRRGEVLGGAMWVADTGSNDTNRVWNTFNRDVISVHDVDINVSSWKSWSRVVGKGILFMGWSENAILNSTAEFHDIHATINAPSLSQSDGSTITAWSDNVSNNLTIVGEAMTDGNGDPMLDEYGNQLYTVQFYDNTYNWYTITKDDAGNFIYTPARGGNGGEIANNYGGNSAQNNNNVFDLENIYMRGQREDAVSVTYNGVRYGYFTQDGEGNWVYTHTADQTVDTPADVEAGSEVPADTYYEAVLADGRFVKGTDYYTRSGSGTVEDPYVYTLAKVAYGNRIAADTYYRFTLTDDAVFSAEKTYYSFANHYVGHSGNVVIRDAEGNAVCSFNTADVGAQLDDGAITAYVADAASGTDKRLYLGTFAESGTNSGGAVYLGVYKLAAVNNLVIHGYNANSNGGIIISGWWNGNSGQQLYVGDLSVRSVYAVANAAAVNLYGRNIYVGATVDHDVDGRAITVTDTSSSNFGKIFQWNKAQTEVTVEDAHLINYLQSGSGINGGIVYLGEDSGETYIYAGAGIDVTNASVNAVYNNNIGTGNIALYGGILSVGQYNGTYSDLWMYSDKDPLTGEITNRSYIRLHDTDVDITYASTVAITNNDWFSLQGGILNFGRHGSVNGADIVVDGGTSVSLKSIDGVRHALAINGGLFYGSAFDWVHVGVNDTNVTIGDVDISVERGEYANYAGTAVIRGSLFYIYNRDRFFDISNMTVTVGDITLNAVNTNGTASVSGTLAYIADENSWVDFRNSSITVGDITAHAVSNTGTAEVLGGFLVNHRADLYLVNTPVTVGELVYDAESTGGTAQVLGGLYFGSGWNGHDGGISVSSGFTIP